MATSIATQSIFGEQTEIFAPRNAPASAAPERKVGAVATRELASAGWLARIEMRRVWMWRFLALLAASQIHFLREVLGAYLIFAAVFAAVAAVVVGAYMTFHIAQAGLARLSHFGRRAAEVTRVTETAR